MNIPEIQPVDSSFGEKAQNRWDHLTKPQGSLGKLEEIVCRLCAIQKSEMPALTKKRLIVFAADHGITQEHVSAYPQEVTKQMVRGFLSERAAICVLARHSNIELVIADAGIAGNFSHPNLLPIHIADGSRNFLKEPAMTAAQCEQAIAEGIGFAEQAKKDGVHLLGGGEMGIGNTTSASAIFASLFTINPDLVTGRGTGLDDRGRLHKVSVIRDALQKWKVDPNQPLEILRYFGGFEIACLSGLYLGCGHHQIPAIVDGFICTAAAAIAIHVAPNVRGYLIFAHHSAEIGFDRVVERLNVHPLLNLNLRLGEGTGAALAMQFIEQALHLFMEMPTFEQAEVSQRIE